MEIFVHASLNTNYSTCSTVCDWVNCTFIPLDEHSKSRTSRLLVIVVKTRELVCTSSSVGLDLGWKASKGLMASLLGELAMDFLSSVEIDDL
jgi:hypothetical protein